jgi:small-conductance mechanosensitive channel
MKLDMWLTVGIQLVLIVAVAVLCLVVARVLSRRALKSVRASEKMLAHRKKHLQTIIHVALWIVNAAVVVTSVMMLLGHFVDITPILASVGVLGLAVSLGAQTLIKDLLGGLTILIEDQYTVGDVIKVGEVSGAVERMTLRATYVRDIDGSLHLVPNGDVRVVANITRDWSRALVDIGVAYEEDLSRVLSILEQEAQRFAQNADFADQLLEPPTVLGPLSLGDWAITVRVMVKTLPGKQWGVAVALRKQLLEACEREHVTLPYPRQEVWVRQAGQE